MLQDEMHPSKTPYISGSITVVTSQEISAQRESWVGLVLPFAAKTLEGVL